MIHQRSWLCKRDSQSDQPHMTEIPALARRAWQPQRQLDQAPKMLLSGPGCAWPVWLVSEFQVRQNSVQNCFKRTLYVTFLVVFFSYCKYRDSTTLPPVGDTLLVYNKTMTWTVRTHHAPRMPVPHPESRVLSALPVHPQACMGHLLYARTYMEGVPWWCSS